jgi:hypothetical protein
MRVKEPLSLENIPKDCLIPYFDVLLKGLELLLETIHERSIIYLIPLPPGLDITKEVRMREP